MLRMAGRAQTSAEADVGEVATPRKGRLSGCKRPHSESALPELKPFHPCSLPLQGRAAVAAEHSTESSAAQQEQERGRKEERAYLILKREAAGISPPGSPSRGKIPAAASFWGSLGSPVCVASPMVEQSELAYVNLPTL